MTLDQLADYVEGLRRQYDGETKFVFVDFERTAFEPAKEENTDPLDGALLIHIAEVH